MGNTQSQTVPDHESVFHPKPREMSITDRFNEFVAFLARNKQGTCFYLFDPLIVFISHRLNFHIIDRLVGAIIIDPI